MKNFRPALQSFELALESASVGGDPKRQLENARKSLGIAIASACEMSGDLERVRLSDLIGKAATEHKGRRESAIFIIRALSIDGLLPFEEDRTLEWKVIDLIEAGFGDQCRALKLSEKRQTYEKINALRGLHQSICANLQVLRELPATFAEIDGINADIQKALRHGQCSAYLQPYDWTTMKGKVTFLMDQVRNLVACNDATYKALFEQLEVAHRDLKGMAEAFPTFLTKGYVLPFVFSIERALTDVKQSAVDQFECTIKPRRKLPNIAEKRYPLHQVNKLLTITVPLVNEGPGVAVDVNMEVDCGKCNSLALDDPEIRLGDIRPGEFAASFKAMVVEPSDVVDMAMQISWTQLFGETRSIALNLRLTGQDPTVDWGGLEQLDPYSVEPALDENFVGRKAKVQAIGNRLLKAQMSSTYITGQKRIGKTSLAKAVLRYVEARAKPPLRYETFYLEWGAYVTADARSTLKALGQEIYEFLRVHLPSDADMRLPDFDGSLAPLNSIAKTLETIRPEKRFIIVLDEFDEIHPEMYRYGALAEAFFANLRTLGARRNLAFILVGGEKMPFIIGAQGDQLNKFVREPLDYFSRSDEWADYVELVTGPGKDCLNWEESALNELFYVTNGHPYYTKLLCGKIFSNAVSQRDTEILDSDVRHALNDGICELDTNAFAHFWKDGINSDKEEAQVIELKRQRVLVAFGRALRTGTSTRDGIEQNINGSLQPNEIGPLLDDFFRRDVMEEKDRNIVMQLPIFERWIRDIGVTKIIASTLADDLETELQKARDVAYVQSQEIEALVRSWPLYRGQKITGETVRAWLNQVTDVQEQRILFLILQNLRFINTEQIGELLKSAHNRVVIRGIPHLVRDNKVEKRRDVLVTYLAGPGKSGAAYARTYAKENGLLMECVVEPARALRLIESEKPPSALIVVDDLAGTGRSVADSVKEFLGDLCKPLATHKIPLFLVILYATEEAENKINSSLRQFDGVNATVHICETLSDRDRAFPADGCGLWGDEQSRDRARALCIRLGTGLYKEPLGFGSQGLLIAFSETCPNNSLPILFASREGKGGWTALLPRQMS